MKNNFILGGFSFIIMIFLSNLSIAQPNWIYTNTGIYHTIILPADSILINGQQAEIGDYIGVFYNSSGIESCCGYTQYTGMPSMLYAFGATQSNNNGLQASEVFTFKIWKSSNQEIYANAIADYSVSYLNTNQFVTGGVSSLIKLRFHSTYSAFGPIWAKSAGGYDLDKAHSVATDSEGNSVIVGSFRGLINFGSYELSDIFYSYSDIFIVKVDLSGNVLWAHSAGSFYEDEATSVSFSHDGGIIMTGRFQDTIHFQNTTLVSLGNYDIFVTKYDTNGNLLWATSIGGNSFEGVNSCTSDTEGSVYIAGSFLSNNLVIGNDTLDNQGNGAEDIFIIKLDSIGNPVWAKSHGGIGNDVANEICADGSGNVYVTGYTESNSIIFGQDTLLSNNRSSYLIKYDLSGSISWAKKPESYISEGNSLDVDNAGNVYITGSFMGYVIIFGNDTLTKAGYSMGIFIAKYNGSGSPIWAVNSGNGQNHDYPNSIKVDSHGNVFVAGNFSSPSLTFGGTILNKNGNEYYSQDIFLAKYNNFGIPLWATREGGINDEDVTSIASDHMGNIFMTGRYYSPISFGEETLVSSGDYDIFLVKYGQEYVIEHQSNSVQCNGFATGSIDITICGGVLPYSVLWSNGNTQEDLSNIPAGDYSVTISDGNNITMQKTITISQPNPIEINYLLIDFDENSCNNAAIDLSVSGGSSGYSYQWSNGEQTEDISELVPGIYQITVTDANGCSKGASISTEYLNKKFNVNGITSLGGTGQEKIISIKIDELGNQYIFGTFSGSNFNVGDTVLNSVGENDIFLAKKNPQGNSIWVKKFGGFKNDNAKDMDIDFEGNIYITGIFYSPTLLFGSYSLSNYLGISSYNDFFIAKLNPAGHVVWAEEIGNQYNDNAKAIVVDSNQNCYIVGDFNSPVLTFDSITLFNNNTYVDGFITKIDSNGDFSWARKFSESNYAVNYFSDIVLSEFGNLYAICKTNYSSDFKLLMLDSGGNSIWSKTIPGNAENMDIDQNGNIYIGGSFTSTLLDYGNGLTLTNNYSGTLDCFVIKCNPDGDPLWVKGYGNINHEYDIRVHVDKSDRINVTGWFNSNQLTIENSTYQLNGSYDMFFIKLDHEGNVLFHKAGGGSGDDYIYCMDDNNFNDIVLAGYSTSSDFNFDGFEFANNGSYDALEISIHSQKFITKLTNTNLSCYNELDGSITLSTCGGISPFSYEWSNGTTSSSVANLSAGEYSVTVTDANGTREISSIIITQPDSITIASQWNNVSCINCSDASISLIVNGGTPPYSYSWSNGMNSNSISGIGAGDFLVSLSDTNGCIANHEILIPNTSIFPEQIQLASGNSHDYGSLIETDANGNVYSVGHFTQGNYSIKGTTLISNGLHDIFIVKYDINQNLIWAKSFGGDADDYCKALVIDSEGSIIIAGSFNSHAISFGGNSFTNPNFGNENLFICKLDSIGNVQWANTAFSLNSTAITSICIDNNNNIYTTGYFSGIYISFKGNLLMNTGGFDSFIYKISPNGDYIWANKTWSSGDEFAQGISIDDSGNLLIIGKNTGNCSFGNYSLSSGSYLSKLNQSGEFINAFSFDNYEHENYFIEAAGTNSYLIATDNYIRKYDQNNNIIWSQNLGNTIKTLHYDMFNNIYVGGNFFGTKQLGENVITNQSTDYTDGFIAQLDSTGNILWGTGFGSNLGLYSTNNQTSDTLIQVYYEDFSSGNSTALPNGWSTYNLDASGSSYVWTWTNTGAQGSAAGAPLNSSTAQNGFVLFDSDYFGQVTYNAFLVSPPIDLSDYTNCYLTFEEYYKRWANEPGNPYNGNPTYVGIILQNDTFWIEQHGNFAVNGTTSNPNIVEIDVSAYSGQFIQIVWRMAGFYDYWWKIDDIKIFGNSSGQIGDDFVNNIATDNFGHIYMTGGYQSTPLLFGTDTIYNNDGLDYFLGCYRTFNFQHNFTISNPTCHQNNNGSITINLIGGMSPYSYNWSNGASTQSINGLSAGWYFVTITDADSNEITDSLELTDPTALNLSFNQSAASCQICPDGTINMEVSGGTPPYIYQWNTGETTEDISIISPGIYNVSVADFNSCMVSETIELFAEPIPVPWNYTNTGIMHTIYIPYTANIETNSMHLSVNDVIGVFYENGTGQLECGGYAIWNGVNTALTAWGNDSTSNEKDGFEIGEEFVWKVWKSHTGNEFMANVEYISWPTMPDSNLFVFNGMSGISTLSIEAESIQNIDLPVGWSYFSTNVDLFEANIDSLMSDIIQDVIIVKEAGGNTYWPQWGINLINNIQLGKGYQIKMSNHQIAIAIGYAIQPEFFPILIPSGWSFLGYLRQNEAAIEDLLEPIINSIQIMKNSNGDIYWPQWGVNNIINMYPGKGYQLKTITQVTFTYPSNFATLAKSEVFPIQEMHLIGVKNTGTNMTLGLLFQNIEFDSKAEIGIYSESGLLVGASSVFSNFVSITIWGDDILTDEIDGLQQGEKFTIKLWDGNESPLSVSEWIENNNVYEANKISIGLIDTTFNNDIDSFKLFQNVPNPVTHETKFSFYLPKQTTVIFSIYNISGQLIKEILNSQLDKGNHEIDFLTRNLSPGVYYYELKSNEYSEAIKMIIIK